MRILLLLDPGTPDLRSPRRFLQRVLWLQRGTVAGGACFVWMGSQALSPYVVGHAIDDGVAPHVAAFRTQQWLVRQTVHLGADLAWADGRV